MSRGKKVWPPKAARKGGRKPLKIVGPRGRAIYEAMLRQRTPNGLAWSTTVLGEMVGDKNGPARWIGGKDMGAATLDELAKVLGTTRDALRDADLGQIYLINLGSQMESAVQEGLSDPVSLIRELARIVETVRAAASAPSAKASGTRRQA